MDKENIIIGVMGAGMLFALFTRDMIPMIFFSTLLIAYMIKSKK